ncbi:MAG: putative lipid II flippase FtsW [Deltaproteobacteria bacterium]|nr:putative lipid II flippase FtsW [Deltaproteobacteria bacterium]
MSTLSTTYSTPAHDAPRAPFLLDAGIVLTVFVLVGFSLVMVYSTTGIVAQEKLGDTLYFVKRQAVAAVIGILAMFLFSRINIQSLQKISPYLFFACIALLAVTLIPGVGHRAGGAQRWINLGLVRFQPGELVKVMFIVFIAGFWARHETRLSEFSQGIVKPFFLVAVVAGLLLVQPDFGSAAVISLVTLGMALATGVRLRYIACGAVLLALCMGTLVFLSPYRMQRIMSFLSPFSDVSGRGYQLIQSLIAVGTGQLTGVGLGDSQQKLFFLPAAHTDFIFAVVSEELGFIGGVVLLASFLVLLWRGLLISSRLAENTFQFSLAVGLTLLIVAPALLNIGVVTGLLPTKGMVLPLVGYGGSSLVTCLMAVGMLLALKRHHQEHA